MAIALRYAARSDLGLLRGGNEDSGYAGPRLLVVADGVGGHAAGEVASSVAVSVLSTLDEEAPGGDLLERLSSAVTNANTYLRDMVRGDPELRGMSTTVTALLRAGSRFGLVHVGDSRVLPAARRTSCSRSPATTPSCSRLIDEGRITPEEADHHPQRSVITNALDGARARRPRPVGARGPRRRPLSALQRRPVRRRQRGHAARDAGRQRRARGRGRAAGRARAARAVVRTTSPRSSPTSSRSMPSPVRSPRRGRRGSGGHQPSLRGQLRRRQGGGTVSAARRRRRRLRRRRARPHHPCAARAAACCWCWRCSPAAATAPGAGRSSSTTSVPRARTSRSSGGSARTSGRCTRPRSTPSRPIALSDLPDYQQDRVRADIAADNLTDAQRIVTHAAPPGRDLPRRRPAPARAPSPQRHAERAPRRRHARPSRAAASPPSPTPTPTASADSTAPTDDPATADCGGDGP